MIEGACAKVGGVPTASVVRGLLATRGSMSLPRFLTPRHGRPSLAGQCLVKVLITHGR